MKYAVVKVSGSQFLVEENDEIEVARVNKKEGEIFDIPEVLLLVNDDKVKIGNPFLKGAKIEAKLLKNFLGEKLHVYKFKAKTGYRRKMGFRPKKSLLRIEKIVQ
ncbi:MAG: 50S ribosomal protein L21 [Microgenomates group bacterium]